MFSKKIDDLILEEIQKVLAEQGVAKPLEKPLYGLGKQFVDRLFRGKQVARTLGDETASVFGQNQGTLYPRPRTKQIRSAAHRAADRGIAGLATTDRLAFMRARVGKGVENTIRSRVAQKVNQYAKKALERILGPNPTKVQARGAQGGVRTGDLAGDATEIAVKAIGTAAQRKSGVVKEAVEGYFEFAVNYLAANPGASREVVKKAFLESSRGQARAAVANVEKLSRTAQNQVYNRVFDAAEGTVRVATNSLDDLLRVHAPMRTGSTRAALELGKEGGRAAWNLAMGAMETGANFLVQGLTAGKVQAIRNIFTKSGGAPLSAAQQAQVVNLAGISKAVIVYGGLGYSAYAIGDAAFDAWTNDEGEEIPPPTPEETAALEQSKKEATKIAIDQYNEQAAGLDFDDDCKEKFGLLLIKMASTAGESTNRLKVVLSRKDGSLAESLDQLNNETLIKALGEYEGKITWPQLKKALTAAAQQ